MYKIRETIIVEGLYDKIKLSRFIEGVIFVTNGFTVFKNDAMQQTIKELGRRTGIVILTDSDSAGFMIRNFVKQLLPENMVKHAYIPAIDGKERRKRVPGKEGILGVEGVSENIIIDALKKAGCTVDGRRDEKNVSGRVITKADMYSAGLSGGENSRARRIRLAESLGLPYKISTNMLLSVLNRLFDYGEFCELIQNMDADAE